MSANREDALSRLRGPRPPFDDAPPAVVEVADSTEDIGGENTSELGGTPARGPASVQAPPPSFPPEIEGAVLRERYRIESLLGTGGTAQVHRAVDLRRDPDAPEGRHVAIKVLRPGLRSEATAVARLQREFRQARSAAHPGVVRVFDLDCDRGLWFIVMELLTGETLRDRLRRAGRAGLPAAEALRFAADAGDALAHAHAAGVVHGDVKPGNLFLTASGELRLLDFGAAPATPDSGPSVVPAAATRRYASPAVLAQAPPGPADDVFSLACVTYEMLAGAHPFAGQPSDAAARAGLRPGRPASLDEARWKSLAGALALAPDERPGVADLARLLRTGPAPMPALPVPTAADPLRGPAPPRRDRRTPLAACAAILALALGVLIGRQREPEAPPRPPLPAGPAPAVVAIPSPAMAEASTPGAEPAPAIAPAGRDPQAAPSATAGPPGLVHFDAPRMVVSRDAVVAAIPLRHLSRIRRAATVKWRIVEGSARVERDFGGPLTGAETFVEGNAFRILYVPILPVQGPARERQFSVELDAPSAGTALGPNPRVEVRILGDA